MLLNRSCSCVLAAAVAAVVVVGSSPSSVLADPVGSPPATATTTQVGPATAPSVPGKATPDQIAAAVQKLGDDDFAAREAAARFLWQAGHAAEPALREAADSPEPEVASRAAAILRDFRFGLSPDAPPQIRELVNQYTTGDARQRQTAIETLANRFPRRVGLILRLTANETDAAVRNAADQLLGRDPAAAAATCIAIGDVPAAEKLLRNTGAPSYDLAALLLLHGGIDEEITALKAEIGAAGADQNRAVQLAILQRAKGDAAAAALATAQTAGDPAMTDDLRLILRQYRPLAEEAEKTADVAGNVDAVNMPAALWAMAGDAQKLEASLGRLRDYLRAKPTDAFYVAKAMFLLDRPDEGMRTLLGDGPGGGTRDAAGAAELLAERMDYDKALDVLAKAQTNPDEHVAMAAARAGVLNSIGERKRASDALDDAVSAALGQGWATVAWAPVVEAELDLGRDDAARKHAADFVAHCRLVEQQAQLMASLFPKKSEAAMVWWPLLRQRFPADGATAAVARLSDLLTGKTPPKEVEALATAAGDGVLRHPDNPYRLISTVSAIADTLYDAGCDDAAESLLRRAAAAADDPAPLVRVGDHYAKRKRWDAAAGAYAEARDIDPAGPVPQYLYGYALEQGGHEADGRAAMDLATLLPLARDGARYELVEAMTRHGRDDDAAKQLDLFARLGTTDSWYVHNAWDRQAHAAAERNDYATAAALMQQADLALFKTNTAFLHVEGYLQVPYLINTYRGRAAVDAGDIATAKQQIDLALTALPGNPELAIALCGALERQGHADLANDVYNRTRQALEQSLAHYPNNATAHNNLAWLAVKCGRDLDVAFDHAQKACALEPDKAALLDTLAEVYSARGDKAKALEYESKSLAADPDNDYIKKQVEKYRSALGVKAQ